MGGGYNNQKGFSKGFLVDELNFVDIYRTTFQLILVFFTHRSIIYYCALHEYYMNTIYAWVCARVRGYRIS